MKVAYKVGRSRVVGKVVQQTGDGVWVKTSSGKTFVSNALIIKRM